jgi:hypothetical protein
VIARRAVLGGLGAGVLAGRLRAAGAWVPPVLLDTPNALVQGGWLRGRAAKSGLTLDGAKVPQADNGAFFVAFDRDCGPKAVLAAQWADGTPFEQTLTIAPRDWRIEHVDAPFHPPAMPDEEFARARKDELAQIGAAMARNASAQGWRQAFIWPGKGRVSGLFGAQRVYRGGVAGSYHSGTDIALAAGTPYVAPADGVVVLAADHPFTLEGNLLMVDHGMGLVSAFLHSSALLVGLGERVAQGQPLGRVGMTGRASGPHLHWGLRWRTARLDPLLFVS